MEIIKNYQNHKNALIRRETELDRFLHHFWRYHIFDLFGKKYKLRLWNFIFFTYIEILNYVFKILIKNLWTTFDTRFRISLTYKITYLKLSQLKSKLWTKKNVFLTLVWYFWQIYFTSFRALLSTLNFPNFKHKLLITLDKNP